MTNRNSLAQFQHCLHIYCSRVIWITTLCKCLKLMSRCPNSFTFKDSVHACCSVCYKTPLIKIVQYWICLNFELIGHVISFTAWNHTLCYVIMYVTLQGSHTRAGGAVFLFFFPPLACNYFSLHLSYTLHFSSFSSPNTEGGILIAS